MNPTEYLQTWSISYKKDLIDNIMPFWMQHGWDRKNGGVYTCVDREGKLMDTTKSVWFQGRFAFTCSYAFNHVDRNPEWLMAAKSTLDFIEKHCFDADGRMYFEVSETGMPIRKRRYVFSETFAAIAMAEHSARERRPVPGPRRAHRGAHPGSSPTHDQCAGDRRRHRRTRPVHDRRRRGPGHRDPRDLG